MRPTRSGIPARLIAFYLPQFSPNPHNDRWWGPGFTEWTHVAAARPLFRGHYQPRLPGELGFYDLRVGETREAQAELAAEHGIEAFCYWHYWFAGERLLEKPFESVLKTGKPDYPFCLAWANASWTGVWHGVPNRVLKAQTYPGKTDHQKHFEALLPAFSDPRYLKVEGRPLFLLYRPREIPETRSFTDQWRELAYRAGFPGLHLVGIADGEEPWPPEDVGLDALTLSCQSRILFSRRKESLRGRVEDFCWRRPTHSLPMRFLGHGLKRLGQLERLARATSPRPRWIYRYEDALRYFLPYELSQPRFYPTVVPSWDNTPRCGREGLVLHQSTPELFSQHVGEALGTLRGRPRERRLLFIKSWNEWAEGNYLEPDRRFGRAYLQALRASLSAHPFCHR